jgi:hypothetical protein
MHRIKELNPLPLVPVVFLRITIATDVVIVVSRLPLPIILDCKMLVKQLKFVYVYHERRSLNFEFEAHNLVLASKLGWDLSPHQLQANMQLYLLFLFLFE